MTLSRSELEWRLIYAVLVAGKTAECARAAIGRLLEFRLVDESPLDMIARLCCTGQIEAALKSARTGKYELLCRCFVEMVEAELDPSTCTVEQLEAIYGIGPKTARFFVLWTRPGERYAALDVHILHWLYLQGHNAPRHTPSQPKYGELEAAFIAEADKRGLTPGELDARIWDAAKNGGAVA